MRFMLRFEGPLPAKQGKKGVAEDKYRIRRQLHLQLEDLWNQDAVLRNQRECYSFEDVKFNPQSGRVTDSAGRLVARGYGERTPHDGFRHYAHVIDGRFRFVPLVTYGSWMACSVDITLLREGHAGNLVLPCGDIDNRIKVLLDGLRMPHTLDEIPASGRTPDAQNFFFCLLEDDSLITDLRVSTERLLMDRQLAVTPDHVFALIDVKIKPVMLTQQNLLYSA